MKKIKFKIFLLALISFLFLGSIPVYAQDSPEPEDWVITENGNNSYTITEYRETYSIEFVDNKIKVNDNFYSRESYNASLKDQSDETSKRKALIHYLDKYEVIAKESIHSSKGDIKLFSVSGKPPTTGYRSFGSKYFTRPVLGGLYVTLAAASVAGVAAAFGISPDAARSWINGFLSAIGMGTAFVSGYEKVWTATHTTCGAAAKDRVLPFLKYKGYDYDAETPSGSPLYLYRTYWYTDPSGYPGC